MRLTSLSIVVLAGAVMASAGAIAENLSSTRRINYLDVHGLLLVWLAFILLVVELLLRRPSGPNQP